MSANSNPPAMNQTGRKRDRQSRLKETMGGDVSELWPQIYSLKPQTAIRQPESSEPQSLPASFEFCWTFQGH
jgi:hypothetical protein